MDLRLVNTCNNSCLYCLEQSYREKEKYIDINKIISNIRNNILKNTLTFYWWNPLLHPDLIQILIYCRNKWYKSIGLLTNTYSLNKFFLYEMIHNWLTTIWFYFNSFDEKNHDKIVNWWISLSELENNIELIKRSEINYKAIIHINKLNIISLYKDLVVLNKKHFVKNFEFINYFPFDRPYDKFKDMLEYNYNENRIYINLLFKTIEKLNLDVKFFKFNKSFFWAYTNYYDFENWILKQIWEEDKDRLSVKIPYCYKERRCYSCFLMDNCKHKI